MTDHTPEPELTSPQVEALQLTGKDNYGKPRQNFADKLAAADDAEYMKIAEERIWLSAWADNNARSDYHWQADTCYDEAIRRGDRNLYQRAWNRAAGHDEFEDIDKE